VIKTPTFDTTSELLALVSRRFLAPADERLADAVRRYQEGGFPGLDAPLTRLLFVAWLVAQGKLSDELPDPEAYR